MRYFIILFFIQGILLHAQSKLSKDLGLKYPSINFTTKDGLPSNETYCVFQDSKGYIWIGTDRGLVKFDGYDFKTFTTLDGLTDNVILAINEDKDGNIWYTGLNNLQIGFISPKMEFKSFQYHQILLDSINKIEDFYNNAKLLMGVHFNKIFFDNDDLYLLNNQFGYVVFDNKGISEVHLSFNPDSILTKSIIGDNLNIVYSPKCFQNLHDIDNNIYVNDEFIGSYNRKKSEGVYPTSIVKDSVLYLYDDDNYTQISGRSLKHELLSVKCSSFKLDAQTYLFSTYGVNDKNGEIFISNSPDFNQSKELIYRDCRIANAIKDNNGGIWISTLRKGIVYFPGLKSRQCILNNSVEGLFSSYEGIDIFTKGNSYRFSSERDSISNFKIDKVFANSFYRMNKKNFHISLKVNPNVNKEKPWLYNSVLGFQKLNDSLFYILQNRSIYKVKKGNTELVFPDTINKYVTKYIESLYCFKNDSCLIGTKTGLYNYVYGKLNRIDLVEKDKRVRHIDYIESENIFLYHIWGEGLTLYTANDSIIRYSTENGLVSNVINDIYVDEYNTVWLATNKGINSLYIERDSLILNTFFKSSKLLSSPNILQIYVNDSVVYLGSDVGFDIIDLKENNFKKSIDQPVFITNLKINSNPYVFRESSLSLPYDSNNLIINYTSIDFDGFGKIEYRYRLNGYSDTWVKTKERRAVYFQIPPGDYSFELEAQDEFGNWIKSENLFKFKIANPWWFSWWFILMIASTLGLIMYYYISNVKKERRFLIKENEFVENEKLLSEKLNQSQQKALNSQLNPHFVFNSLNSIQNFILTNKADLSSDYLSMFSKLMRFVFENSKKLYIPLSDEIQALKLYLDLEQARHNKEFEYEILFDEKLSQSTNTPSLLVQPIVENSIWHGLLPKSGEDKRLEIRIYFGKENLKIIVFDNGVGRNSAQNRQKVKVIKKQKSSGIELTKQRLLLIEESTGLPTSFNIEDLFDENGDSKGTKVSIEIPISL